MKFVPNFNFGPHKTMSLKKKNYWYSLSRMHEVVWMEREREVAKFVKVTFTNPICE